MHWPAEQSTCPKCGKVTYWRYQPPHFLNGVHLEISIKGQKVMAEITAVKSPDWVCPCGHVWK